VTSKPPMSIFQKSVADVSGGRSEGLASPDTLQIGRHHHGAKFL